MVDRLAGSIYDLGYRAYQGERLGRRYAVLTLFWFSLRGVFGIGRSWLAKAFPIGFALISLVPALIQTAVAAIAPVDVDFITAEDYFGISAVVLALFCAAAAPELVGKDQRSRTLSLYFSRALSRLDYAGAKLGALAIALFAIVLAPQLLLLLGQAIADDDLVGYLGDEADKLAPIVASSLLVAVVMGSIAIAIATQTSRRALAVGGVLGYFVVASLLGSVLVATVSGEGAGYALMISPIGLLEGSVHWTFGSTPAPESDSARAGLEGAIFFAGACAYAAVAAGLFLRRMQRLSV